MKDKLLFMLGLGVCAMPGGWTEAYGQVQKQTQERPNVLFIIMDDMCDWANYLGGNNQVKTPNLDRLAARGVYFSNAYAAVPLSNPSRTAMMTGLQPFVTGIYNNNQQLQDSPQVENATLMPEHFKQNGYTTVWSGKIFHNKPSDAKLASSWDDMEYRDGGYGPWAQSSASEKKSGKARKGPNWDEFEPWVGPDTDFPDVVNSQKVIDFLGEEHDKPFFVAMGFYRPHTPHTAPKRYFDLYDLDSIKRPDVLPNDLDDIPPYAIEHFIGDKLEKARRIMNSPDKQWEKEIWSYLASVSFADDRIGMILDALDRSPYADNTVIVLVGDNGFHHGQKERFGKSALWREACHVPFIVCGPKNNPIPQGVCEQPVSLIDIYPTLNGLCGLPQVDELAGNDLTPLLNDPQMKWNKPSISTFLPGNFTVHYGKWNYIRYADGSQELYDTQADEDEFYNQASDSKNKALIRKMGSFMPKKWHPGVKPRELKYSTRTVFAKANVAEKFENPLGRGQDPWIIKHDGKYYTCASGKGGIVVTESRFLTRVENRRVVWTPPTGSWNSYSIWAPELHFIDGKWYIYYAAGKTPGSPYYSQRTGVLECDTPLGDYVDKGMVYTGDDPAQEKDNVWAIDMTVLEVGGKRYAVWSGWNKQDPASRPNQNLYIAPMITPWKLGQRVLLSEPVEPWECGEQFELQEGPQVLKHGDDVFIIYSTRGSWTMHYKLGQLRLKPGANPLDPKSWVKSGPVFQGTPTVYGVGHASFTTSPDDTEYWIYYHTKREKKPGWLRDVLLQKFTFDEQGNPVFGEPAGAGPMVRPSGEREIELEEATKKRP